MYAIVNEKGEYIGSTEIKEVSDIPMPSKIINAIWDGINWIDKREEFQPECYFNFEFKLKDKNLSLFRQTVEEIFDICYSKKIFAFVSIIECLDKQKVEEIMNDFNKANEKNYYFLFGKCEYYRDTDIKIVIENNCVDTYES